MSLGDKTDTLIRHFEIQPVARRAFMISSNTQSVFNARGDYTSSRIDIFKERIASVESLLGMGNLCIYATGSYGRLEATEFSDLDLFFIQDPDSPGGKIGKIEKTLIDADVIRLARKEGFPEFSRDGEFLHIHQMAEILGTLGGQEDDFKNCFTARMLLLLESRCLYRQSVYEQMLIKIINSYYRDYHDHENEFLPAFLANDIVRFWKTLCLNYEHRRNRPAEDPDKKAKSQVKNLKLKFSRLMTSYSTLVWLAAQPVGPAPENVLEMVMMSPVRRLEAVGSSNQSVETLVAEALDEYAWFLQTMNQPEDKVLEWFADKGVRDDAFGRGRLFGQKIFELMTALSAQKPFLRYLLV